MWGLCIVVVGHFIRFLHGRHEVCHCRACQIVQRHYKWIGFVPNLLFNVCNQILHPNRNRRTVFQLAKKHGVQQFQSSATNSSGDGAITSGGVSPFEYHLLFKLKFFFFRLPFFGHFWQKFGHLRCIFLKWQKIVFFIETPMAYDLATVRSSKVSSDGKEVAELPGGWRYSPMWTIHLLGCPRFVNG